MAVRQGIEPRTVGFGVQLATLGHGEPLLKGLIPPVGCSSGGASSGHWSASLAHEEFAVHASPERAAVDAHHHSVHPL